MINDDNPLIDSFSNELIRLCALKDSDTFIDASRIIELLRLGLWAKQHAIPALHSIRRSAENGEDSDCLWSAESAIEALPKEGKDG